MIHVVLLRWPTGGIRQAWLADDEAAAIALREELQRWPSINANGSGLDLWEIAPVTDWPYKTGQPLAPPASVPLPYYPAPHYPRLPWGWGDVQVTWTSPAPVYASGANPPEDDGLSGQPARPSASPPPGFGSAAASAPQATVTVQCSGSVVGEDELRRAIWRALDTERARYGYRSMRR